MRLLVDHCVSKRTVDYLRQIFLDIVTCKELGKESAKNSELLRLASSADRVLVTEDRGFGDIRKYPPRKYQGVVLLRPRNPALRSVLHRTFEAFLKATDREAIRECLVVIEETRVRVRR